ncbi:MAG TPA: mechanosensitive ion channel family protein [Candidatus Binataceae bacterium]|nr:mechanosensitive ion channel family protein [Candidatus Binataceae bacterium]
MTETSLQTVLGLAALSLHLRFGIELTLAALSAAGALIVRRDDRYVGPAGFVLVSAGFVSDVLMHLMSRTSEVGLTLEALGLVLFFFGVIRLALDLVDYALPGKVRTSNIFWDLILILLYAVVLMVVLRATLRVDLTSLLATSAVISVIIGFALQETLGNIFAGLAMQMQKPFEPGDWIHFGTHLGRVQGIGWRATRIITRENERLEIPNNLIAKDIVVNYTTGSVADEIFIGLPYEQPPNRVKEVLTRVLRHAHGVARHPEPEVFAVEYGDSAIKYRLRFWLSDYGPQEHVRDAIISNVWYALRRQSIDIPFPIRTVYLHQARGDEDLRAEQEHHLIAELRQVDFLEELGDEEIKMLLPNTRVHQFGNGEVLMHQGEIGDFFHILRRGTVEVVAHAANGGAIHITDLKAPAFVGEIALLTGETRNASVVARSDVEVLELNRDAFTHLFHQRPEALNEISAVVARRIKETTGIVDTFSAQNDRRSDNWLVAKMKAIFGV